MDTQKQPQNVSFDEACSFIIKLGTLAHGYGSTATRLEIYLRRLTEAFGYSGVFRSTPTDIVFSFQKKDELWQQLHLVALPGTGLNLDRLARVGDLIDAVAAGQVSISEASKRLDEIDKTPLPWGVAANAFSYAFLGAGLAVIFAGGWWDVFFSTVLSLIVYGMVLLSGRFGIRTAEWLPLSTTFVVALLASFAKVWIPELNVVIVIVSAIAILLPGYTVSLGIIELVSQHVVSGSANLMSGLVYLAKQFAGGWLGAGLAGMLVTIPTAAAATPVNAQWLWLFMPPLIVGLCVVFQTATRDMFWACFGCAVAYGGILLGSAIAGGNLGNLIGTIIAVIFANLWARRTRRPTSIVLVPAIILLVSGSIGFRGLAAVAAGQTAVGEQQFLQMFIVALTIAVGLLVGNTLVKPKVTL